MLLCTEDLDLNFVRALIPLAADKSCVCRKGRHTGEQQQQQNVSIVASRRVLDAQNVRGEANRSSSRSSGSSNITTTTTTTGKTKRKEAIHGTQGLESNVAIEKPVPKESRSQQGSLWLLEYTIIIIYDAVLCYFHANRTPSRVPFFRSLPFSTERMGQI
ncbi:hypothetical protein OUZ56_019206 [Daphnia magna]|uniref:Uncharacterized protein n=1 Tax=Daphnia magna TaxID=35525 RepID=A0ABQ9ZAZ3_9CRUS|nr:hypothetical protein OUZ56_019206 [Daphnia magna]